MRVVSTCQPTCKTGASLPVRRSAISLTKPQSSMSQVDKEGT